MPHAAADPPRERPYDPWRPHGLRDTDTDEHQLGKTYGSHYTASVTAAF